MPDAEPRVESTRSGGPNKPYYVMGRSYAPMSGDPAFEERGLASWYGTKFHGQSTSSGEPYDMYAMTAAHPTMPIPSYARVRNPANGREVIVRINDRGPFHPGRIIDLSYTAAYKLGLLRGVAPVELQRITYDEIRADSWRRTPAQEQTRLAVAARNAPSGAVATTAATPAAPVAEAVSPSQLTTPATAAEVLPVVAPVVAAVVSPNAAATPAAARVDDAVAAAVVPPSEFAAVDLPVASPRAAAPSSPPPATTTQDPGRAEATRGFWVQLGAFRQRPGAEALQRKVATDADWIGPLLAVFSDQTLFRVQAGPYATQGEAQRAGRRVGDVLGFMPMIVERR